MPICPHSNAWRLLPPSPGTLPPTPPDRALVAITDTIAQVTPDDDLATIAAEHSDRLERLARSLDGIS